MRWLQAVFLLFPLFSSGQDVAFKRYSVENGLAGTTIYNLYFDARGFLWISTETGVSRFDGSTFSNHTSENGLTDNEIIELGGDARGRIWFAGYNGTLSYLQNDTIHPYYENYTQKKLLHTGLVTGIVGDKEGNVWLWGEKLWKINGSSHSVINIPLHEARLIGSVTLQPDGTLLVLAAGYIYRVAGGKIISEIKAPTFAIYPRGIVAYGNGYVIYSSSEIVYGKFLGNKFSPVKHLTFDAEINAVIPGKENSLWISTLDSGLFYYPDIFNSPAVETYLAGQSIGRTVWDAEGGLWVAVNGDGLYYFVNTNAYYFDMQVPQQNSFSVTGDGRGNIFAGLANGSIFKVGEKNKNSLVSSPSIVGGYNRVKDIVCFGDNLWIATDHGLFRQTPGRPAEKINNMGAVKSLAKGDGRALLVGNYEGAFIIHPETYKTRRIYNKRTTAICAGDSGNVYMGTLSGVYYYNSRDNKTSYFNTYGLANKSITCLQYVRGTLWAGTNGQGVVAVFKDSTVIFDQKNGLAGNICKTVYADGEKVWVGTNKGLSCIYLNNGVFEIKNYSQVDGLKSPQVNDVFVRNDSVWIASPAGLSLLLPGTEKDKRHHYPPIYLTRVNAKGSNVFSLAGAVLNYADNSLLFSFIGVSYKSGGKMTYKYRLKGLDDAWKYTTGTQVEYASVAPGNYIFEVYACDYFNTCSAVPAVFSFTIATPYWQTPWFVALLILALAGIIVLIIRGIKKNEARKNHLQRKMIQLELEAVKAQLNPHFIFNSLNSIQYFINNNDYQNSQVFLTRFARLVRNTLEYSARSFIRLEEEIKYLDDYLALEKMRLSDRFDYTITVNAKYAAGYIHVPPMLAQIYIENAVRHGIRPLKSRKGIIKITFTDTGDNLVCTIEDNGIGRLAAAQIKERNFEPHISMGMNINRHRIDILNSVNGQEIILEVIDKTEENDGETGTIIKIIMPIVFNNVMI